MVDVGCFYAISMVLLFSELMGGNWISCPESWPWHFPRINYYCVVHRLGHYCISLVLALVLLHQHFTFKCLLSFPGRIIWFNLCYPFDLAATTLPRWPKISSAKFYEIRILNLIEIQFQASVSAEFHQKYLSSYPLSRIHQKSDSKL